VSRTKSADTEEIFCIGFFTFLHVTVDAIIDRNKREAYTKFKYLDIFFEVKNYQLY